MADTVTKRAKIEVLRLIRRAGPTPAAGPYEAPKRARGTIWARALLQKGCKVGNGMNSTLGHAKSPVVGGTSAIAQP